MIGDWEDLAYDHNPDHPEYDELKAWLRSHTQDSRMTVTSTSHSVELLRSALQAATYEIRDNLDEQIHMLVKESKGYKISVLKSDYYSTRPVEWDNFLPTDIDEMNAEDCAELLWEAKAEIAWLCNEISRLEIYISVEKQMRNGGVKGRNTVLQPLERKKVEQGQRGGEEPPRGRDVEMGEGADSGVDSGLGSERMELDGGRMRSGAEG